MRLTTALCVATALLGANSAFGAITCTTIDQTIPASTTTPAAIAAASSCGKNTNMGNGTSTIGSGGGPAGWDQGSTGGTAVFGLQLGAANANVTVGVAAGSPFIPEIDVVGPNATCQDTDAYVTDASALAIGGAITVNIPSASAAGTYWVFVGDVSGGAGDPGCGAFTLNVTGTLPVKLQSFSVN